MSDERAQSYKYKLKPTAEQERDVGCALWLCRDLYNTAFRATHHAYRRCGVTVTAPTSKPNCPDPRAAFPEYAAIHHRSCRMC